MPLTVATLRNRAHPLSIAALSIAVILGLSPCTVKAQVPIPNVHQCVGFNYFTHQPMQVWQITGNDPAWAISNWNRVSGIPYTEYTQMYFALPPLMQKLTTYHECAHHSIPTGDEFLATCWALHQLRFSKSELAQIASFHQNYQGPVGPQYGGSGAALWAGVVAMCPADAT